MFGGAWAERQGSWSVACFVETRRISSTGLSTLCGGELVLLLAMKEEPPLAARCKDKFLIQSATITPEKETLPLANIVSPRSLPFHAVCY